MKSQNIVADHLVVGSLKHCREILRDVIIVLQEPSVRSFGSNVIGNFPREVFDGEHPLAVLGMRLHKERFQLQISESIERFVDGFEE